MFVNITITQQKKKAVQKTAKKPSEKENDEIELNETKDIDEHPYTIGHHLIVLYRDGSERLVKIIERSSSETSEYVNSWQYYVHYLDFNRRMDEWITIQRIVSPPSIANENEIKKRQEETTLTSELALQDHDIRKLKRSKFEHSEGPTTVDELEHDEHEGIDEMSLKEHEEITKIKNVKNVLLGKHLMECWYFSPFPKEIFTNNNPIECLHFCEFTFRFFTSKEELNHYQNKPNLLRHPPGNEIYRDSEVSMFEVDGGTEKIYCQNICYFAKLFLDHKTLYYDVDAFLFYILCTRDERGYHPVGFFSKEKYYFSIFLNIRLNLFYTIIVLILDIPILDTI